MSDLQKTLESLSGLHDVVVHRLIWIPEDKVLEFDIEDFYSTLKACPSTLA